MTEPAIPSFMDFATANVLNLHEYAALIAREQTKAAAARATVPVETSAEKTARILAESKAAVAEHERQVNEYEQRVKARRATVPERYTITVESPAFDRGVKRAIAELSLLADSDPTSPRTARKVRQVGHFVATISDPKFATVMVAGERKTVQDLLNFDPVDAVRGKLAKVSDILTQDQVKRAEIARARDRMVSLAKLPDRVMQDLAHAGEMESLLLSMGPTETAVWRSERSACLRCADVNGSILSIHGFVGAGLTGDVAMHDRPPAHARCRCGVVILLKNDAADYAETLKRETQRQILRGESDYDSLHKRVEAAASLLESSQLNMPKSVIARAERSIKTGEFPAA